MQFGRVPFEDLDSINWEFPTERPFNWKSAGGPLDLKLGATGWSNKEWKGQLYPSTAKDKEFLHHYAQIFDSVELNSSHYRIPPMDWVERWKGMAHKGFKFCPKLHQQISHRGAVSMEKAIVEQYISFLEDLGEFGGPSFLQLPEKYSPEKAEELLKFLQAWPKEFKLTIEFRHPDWFTDNTQAEEVWTFMEENGIGAVITDTAGRRDVLHMRNTAAFLIIRYVGNHPHQSDQTRIANWISKLSDWESRGMNEAYLFLHQHDNQGVSNILEQSASLWNANHEIQVKTIEKESEEGQLGLF